MKNTATNTGKISATANTNDELRDLLRRIRDDPDAGEWGEWARRLMEGDAERKRKAAERARGSPRPEPAGA
ncbi:hypothetical protein J8F10_21275 [Gemmata sp. G18]|uniref:Uncharacterized protein n=1 Tax=Gemmata palustris TaxID=2822762 RepID=A0ABS5BWK8_9BACT|nr:hypothetical protein [Gemmata palustris]MBP3957792.1 hypothetical protein [Gemmata palustris]